MSHDHLHLVRLILDARELLRIAARHRLPRDADMGYVVHAGLAQLFATSSDPASVPLHTFALDEERSGGDQLVVLGYSDADEGALLAAVGSSARMLVRECASRGVPSIDAGTRVRFRTRICPVVRTRHPGEDGPRSDAKDRPQSREVDAWLHHRFATWQADPPDRDRAPFERAGKEWSERERVYSEWLARELGRGDAATLEERRLDQFRRLEIHRRGTSKFGRRKAPQRPDAVMEGTLRVNDADAFRALLRRGLGRHRAFGFGMLLVHRA